MKSFDRMNVKLYHRMNMKWYGRMNAGPQAQVNAAGEAAQVEKVSYQTENDKGEEKALILEPETPNTKTETLIPTPEAQVNAAGKAAQVEKVSYQTATATFASHPHPITMKS